MDKYEYRVKTEQMLEYMEKKQYKKAMEIADTIDWRRVKNASMLNSVSEIYELNGEYQKSRDILFVAFDRSPGSRKIVYRLGTLALKIDDIEEASDCYEEFVKLAPKDPNQYILKYKILKAQKAPYAEQITALEEFKKAEYVEKWAYELAKLYHEAGMTAECLEECDDLILWFSEGKYVYQAMELKMKYKPLTPLQQEKYDNRPGAPKKERSTQPQRVGGSKEAVGKPQPKKADENKELLKEDKRTDDFSKKELPEKELPVEDFPTAEIQLEVSSPEMEEVTEKDLDIEEEIKKSIAPKKRSAITNIVKGATLEEALANGVALASGINIEENAMKEREEALRITGQMRIEEILQEWEAKQRANAEAIEKQKKEDVQRIDKEREAARRRKEEERLEIERKAAEAEAARKKAEEEAARKAAEEEAARKAAEEEAARKAAEEEAARKAAEEEARKAAEEALLAQAFKSKTQRIPDDIAELVEEMEQREGLGEEADFTEAEFDDELEETEDVLEETEFEDEDEPEEVEIEDEDEPEEVGFEDEDEPEEVEMEDEDEPEEVEMEDEDEPEEVGFEDEDESEDDEFDGINLDDDFDDGNFDEEDEFEEDEFEEAEFEEDEFEEAEFEEDEFEEAEFEEAELESEDFFDEDELAEDASDGELDLEKLPEDELLIEEPSEEEIQERIKKSKGGGVPFDTGFVVTGRYDLSATSEIGLKAGLTEEQKKLFSYFVPVRGMSEQIVEVLDNDRRAQREGTSKTGNLLVIGRKGSGKTVLAVDIVKAIQKQRNLKQGKVAIVTGESLNKKELTNIIQKLRGGAIIIEKAGKLNSRTIKELNYLMERKTGELLFVLEDQRKPIERILTANPEFKKKFTSKLELPVFINDELVTFGQTYAKENGYKLDEMGILALYSRIDVMQREDHAVTVAEVKEIMDEAIAHSQKANVKHLARRVFGKSTDDSDRIILKEEDFRI